MFSLICAFTHDFTQLMICQAVLGLRFGGEWAAGAILIGEAVRPQYRGRAVGTVQSGWAIGWGGAVLMSSIAAAALTVIYTQVPISNAGMLWLGFPLGVAASAYFSGAGPFFTELFPTRLRGSGQGFAYNFGRGIGALFPTLVGFLSASMGLAGAIAVFAVVAYGLLLIAALLLPETRGKVPCTRIEASGPLAGFRRTPFVFRQGLVRSGRARHPGSGPAALRFRGRQRGLGRLQDLGSQRRIAGGSRQYHRADQRRKRRQGPRSRPPCRQGPCQRIRHAAYRRRHARTRFAPPGDLRAECRQDASALPDLGMLKSQVLRHDPREPVRLSGHFRPAGR